MIGLSRESLRYKLKRPEMDKPLIKDMRRFAAKNPDWGCRKILSLLRTAGWLSGDMRN